MFDVFLSQLSVLWETFMSGLLLLLAQFGQQLQAFFG
jgi:hypothetical protein